MYRFIQAVKGSRFVIHLVGKFRRFYLFHFRKGVVQRQLALRKGECRQCGQLAILFRKYRVTHIFASHIHGYFAGQRLGVPYTITGGAGAELVGTDPSHYFYHFLKVHVKGGAVDIHVKPVPSPDYAWLDRLGFITWLYLYPFIRFHGIELDFLLLAGWILVLTLRLRLKRGGL